MFIETDLEGKGFCVNLGWRRSWDCRAAIGVGGRCKAWT